MHDWEVKGKDSILRTRIGAFRDELRRQILGKQTPFEAEVAWSARALPLRDSVELERERAREGEEWGRDWDSGYFRLRAAVPPDWEGEELAAWLDFGGEALVYSPDGEPLYGLSNGSAFDVHYAKDVYRIRQRAIAGAHVELFVEAAASSLFGIDPAPSPASKDDPARHGSRSARTRRMRLCVFDRETWDLSLDVSFLLELLDDLDPRCVRAARILKTLFEASCAHRGESRNASLCRSILAPELAKPAAASALSTTVVGHAHIDTAWLWRTVETRRKVARTFASQLDLIGKYPLYVFGASAPQHHQWIKEDHPGTYARILQAFREGRWEPQGGMWVEADCNLPSGESLVRQLLHGQGFWIREFGMAIRSCWIPDVFGYPASLPQILRKAGIDWFLTQKMSWSKLDEFPHDSFLWRGIDGSEVLTHFPPEYTYNSYCSPEGLRKAETTFHERAFLDEFLTLMGIGDGGGGPKEEHLENVLRSRNVEGAPKASFGGSTGFFERLMARSPELPTWAGELYLEYHRGTYTTQARIKRDNRRLEQELRAAEALLSCLPARDWPAAELEKVVKILLLHQFHDILPGSSIAAVYADAREAHVKAFDLLSEAEALAAAWLCPEDGDSLTFFNCLAEA
ncbi:MAG: hypothetical protein Q8M76_13020, partial [Spirochaetaceae bacterium]|nr:hypothetical protein [Spirochaetaceae bacterium]